MNLNRVAAHSIVLMGCLLVLTSEARAQTNAPKFGTISSRFLLIVETSHPMSRRSDATLKAVGSLLYSGFSHQIKQGDTLGVWTYNQQLYAGRMPLQRWSKPLQHEMVSGTLDFLKSQKYEKQPAFSSVRSALDKVIKDSEFITVVVVSSGEEAMTGTPFDDKINELYKSWKVDQEKARMPFVTVLRAKRGTITSYVAVPVPWQVEIPPWPAETNAAPAVFASSPARVQPAAVPPLIFTGKKSKPAETTNSSEALTTTSESAPPTTVAPGPAVSTIAPAEAASEPSRIASQKPPGTSALPQQTVETQTPQVAADPASTRPKDPVPAASKPESASIAHTNSSNGSNPTRAETAPESTSPRQDISTAIAAPTNSILSGKLIWLGGLAILGLACVVLVALTRRPHSEHISLITRSLEHENK